MLLSDNLEKDFLSLTPGSEITCDNLGLVEEKPW
jgi:hypothetical protein